MPNDLMVEYRSLIIAGMDPREQAVLQMRYNLNGEGRKTLQQIERKVLRKLKHPVRRNQLAKYLMIRKVEDG